MSASKELTWVTNQHLLDPQSKYTNERSGSIFVVACGKMFEVKGTLCGVSCQHCWCMGIHELCDNLTSSTPSCTWNVRKRKKEWSDS